METGWFKIFKRRLTILFFLLIIPAIMLILNYWPQVRHDQAWKTYSHSLPTYVPHFLGRDREIADLVRLLDPQSTAVRTVSIVGPPGFGKSSLAIHVGHAIIDKGAVVNYVNLDKVAIDDLPEKVLGNAGITSKNGSVERLVTWARRVTSPVLLILDNCDFFLHYRRDDLYAVLKRVRESGSKIKFLLTTKHKINVVDEFEEYPLQEIDMEASCTLLNQVAKREITEKNCKSILKQTGNVPLALKVVGSILRTRERNISVVVGYLRKKLLRTLNPKDLDQKVNASISLSYTYLTTTQRTLGRYLALFPGSFTIHDVCSIVVGMVDGNCNSIIADVEMLEQRSLLQSQGRGRYQFHNIIKEFFLIIKKSNDVERNSTRFLITFQFHYGVRLLSMSKKFEKNYASALRELDQEKHNIQFLLHSLPHLCVLDSELLFKISETLEMAVQKGFLMCRFTEEELVKPLKDACNCLYDTIKNMPGVWRYQGQIFIESTSKTAVFKLMVVFNSLILKLQRFISDLSTKTDLLESVNIFIGLLDKAIEIPYATEFFYVLAAHYRVLGDHACMKRKDIIMRKYFEEELLI